MLSRIGVVFGAWAAAAAVASPAADAGYRAQTEAWRKEREAKLRADGGWLSVAGLFWLNEGANRFGVDAANDIVLPAGSAPARAGLFELRGGRTSVRLEPGVSARIAGKAVAEAPVAMRADSDGTADVLEMGRLKMNVIRRGERYGIRLKDAETPRRRAFTGLTWYPIDEAWRVRARFVPHAAPRTVPIPNVLGTVEEMPSPGEVVFSVGGREVRLEPVFEEPDAKELWFIFRDETSGKETYGGGRFLYADLPAAGTVVLDFNKAYSPPCAFTDYATCPLPPKQNRLPVRIEAGEKAPSRH
jgi:uncharacterized protein (DUF1684 family)